MLFENATTNTKQGDIGEARAIYEYTRLGFTVLKPLTDSDKFDLVLYKDGKFDRVQVKTTGQRCKDYRWKNSKRTSYIVDLRTTGGNRRKNTIRPRHEDDYDILFVLTEENRCWSIPITALNGAKTMINVGATGRGAKYTEYELKLDGLGIGEPPSL